MENRAAQDSDKFVSFTINVPVKQVARFLHEAGVTLNSGLTEKDAVKLLRDKEFREVLFNDLIEFSTETLEEATNVGEALDVYADVLNRLQVPHDGILEDDDEDRCEHGIARAACEICTFGDVDLGGSD